jgi:hypothetical protein
MTRNSTVEAASIIDVTSLPFSPPTSARPTPNSTAKNSTWSTSLRDKASNEVLGITLRRKEPMPPPCSLWALSA